MCQGKAAPAAQDSPSSEWATLPASVCGVKWLRSPLTQQGEPHLRTCLTRLKTVIRSAPCPGHQTQRPSALWPCRVQQGWLSREGLACALGLECYDPSQEPAYIQPGTRGHAGGKVSEFLHKAMWQETLRSQVTVHSLSVHFVNCTMNSRRAAWTKCPQRERREPAEAVSSKPLSQQLTSQKLCS